MEVKASTTWRASLTESDLTPSARLVGFALSLYINEKTRSAFPSAATLAKDTGLCLRTVRTSLADLVNAGFLTITHHGGAPKGGVRTSNTYLASIPDRCNTDTRATETPVQSTTSEEPRPVQSGAATGATVAHELEVLTRSSTELIGEAAEAAPADAKSDIVARNRDLLAEAVAAACRYDLRGLTESARGAFNRALKDLRAVNADPAEVEFRAKLYRSRFTTPLTPMALAKNWPGLTPEAVMADIAGAPTLPKAAGAIARARGRR